MRRNMLPETGALRALALLAGRALCVLALLWLPLAHAVVPSAAIASAHPLATEAGHRTLAQGGNAFDAAVAVAAALAVVEPYSSGLGGGGFWLLHRAADGYQVMVDGRETAPAAARPESYLDADGRPVPGATTRGGTSVGIPGTPAAIAHVAHRYGKLPLAQLLAPAIALARNGFPVDPRYLQIARLREARLREGGAESIFLDDGRAPQAGFVLRQPDLAVTLETLAREGKKGFYRGRVGQALVTTVNAAGGAWQLADLERYRVIEREPVRFTYRGARITTAALPSAGGVALAQALAMLERFDLGAAAEPDTAHLVAEALRRAFHDRARFLGDPDHAAVPLGRLLDRGYLARRSGTIDPAVASASESLPEAPVKEGSGNTTHFSVIDAAGNRVGATLTINWLFGSGMVAADTGVLLNNEIDDFTVRTDVPNSYRLRGSTANTIGPGKRPLSSMTPTFVEDDKGVLVVGAPGGSRIVSQVMLAVLEYLRMREVDLERLVALPRYHHQYWPDQIEVEPDGFAEQWRAALAAKGHVVQTAGRRWGNMQAVFQSRTTGAAFGASDPRGSGVAWY